MKKIILFFSLCFISVCAFGSSFRHDIRIEITGLQDTSVILIYYFGAGQYIKDTLPVTTDKIVIQGDSLLHSGMYSIINFQKEKLLDFFADIDDQQFSLTTHKKDIANNMSVSNSQNNSKFYEWVRYIAKQHRAADSLKNKLTSAQNKKKTKKIRDELGRLDKKVKEVQSELFNPEPQLLVSRFIKAQQEIEVPQKNSNGSEMDKSQRYYYLKEHYFDNLSLNDQGLLYTPAYDAKVDWYFRNMITPVPDSVIIDGDLLIEQSKGNPETYKYMVWKATHFSETSTFMGMDKAFVHFIDNYYTTNDSLIMPEIHQRLIKRADELRRSLIGQSAPNMIMQDSALRLQSLDKIATDFVIIYFFDPDCGHCKSETDTLRLYYEPYKTKYDLEVFAVCSDTGMAKMKKYIRDKHIPWIVVNGPRTLTKAYGTLYDVPSMPTIYLINREKIILTKRLTARQTLDFIRQYAKEHY